MRKTHIVSTLLVILAVNAAAIAAGTVTFESLLEEMLDRDRIASIADPAYTCKQFSSYDRGSTEPGSPTWWANYDRSYFVRVEKNSGRTEHVLMDTAGPGAVVRFWATWHGPGGGEFSNGTMRVYLDNNPEPAIAGPMADLISGGKLVGPPLSEGVSPETPYRHQGHNLYLPIPYARNCKITYETDVLMDEGARKGEALYYQINYRTYDDETKVESFSMKTLEESRKLVDKTNKALTARNFDPTALQQHSLEDTVEPGAQKMLNIKGPGAIKALQLRLEAEDLSQALRSTVIRIAFDGNRTVWCPIGDFFGTGYHIRPHATWYNRVTEDGTLSCYWTMPFSKNAIITIINLGEQSVKIATGQALTSDSRWTDRSCHFYAAWRQWPEVETQSNENSRDHGALDLNWLTVKGRGTYVGDVLTLFNTAQTWWGEGDEKIYVDGESFPSHIGTGTEDYYGYAWCKPNFFDSAFHAQPSGDGNLTYGFSVNSRFRALDAIPFENAIQFDMELWHWARTVMSYAPTTIFYARPGATHDVPTAPEEAKRTIPRVVEDIVKPVVVENAIEGETLPIIEKTGGVTEIQDIPRFRWSRNKQLWWRNAKENDTLTTEFEVDSPGDYDIILGTTKAIDYAIVRITINGATVADSLDLFNSSGIAAKVKLPDCELNRGKNTMKITILGANAEAIKSYMFGLDYLLPQKKK